MSLAEIHTLLAMNRELIAQTWNFFVSVHLAITGIIFVSQGNRVPIVAKAALVPAYLGFMYINFRAQMDNYQYTRKILEYAQEIEATAAVERATLSVIFKTGWIIEYLSFIYGGAAIFAIAIIFLGSWQRK